MDKQRSVLYIMMKHSYFVFLLTFLQLFIFVSYVIFEPRSPSTTYKINIQNNDINIFKKHFKMVENPKVIKRRVKIYGNRHNKRIKPLQDSFFKIHRKLFMKPVVEISNVCINVVNKGKIKDLAITAHGHDKTGKRPTLVDGYSIKYELRGTEPNESLIHGYRVKFLSEKIPDSMHHNNRIAFFFDTLPWAFTNLSHFFKDFIIDYFTIMKKFNISSHESIRLFFDESVALPSWITPMLEAGGISPHSMIFQLNTVPPNTCFRKAIFANTRHCEHCKLASHHDVTCLIDHYKIKLNVTDEACDYQKTKILIINRSTNRKILNIEELEKHLKLNTSGDVEIVVMETLSIREQIKKAYCSDVLIGVHGAGLTWATFMRPQTHLIEISWSTAGGLDFFYTKPEMATSLYPNVTLHRVEAFNITDSFEQRKQEFLTRISADVGLHGAESLSHTDKFIDKFKDEIENTPPARYAEVSVDVQELVGIIKSILKQ